MNRFMTFSRLHFKRPPLVMSEVNFYRKDNLAYTEDHVVVFNVFVYHVPRQAREHELYVYFSRFGIVKRVGFNTCRRRARRNAPKVAFIHFKDPKAAAKALDFRDHLIRGVYVTVKACDSWYQPRQAELPVDITDRWSLYLLDLNDDCLEQIFKFLPLKDQINFARTCERFKGVFMLRSKIDYKVFNLTQFYKLTLWETRVFLMLAGNDIIELHGSLGDKYRDRAIKLIGQYCMNLQILRMSSTHIKTSWFYRWLCYLKNIINMQLDQCSLNDNVIRGLTLLPQLRKLNIGQNGIITGRYLPMLPLITDLNVSGCHNLRQDNLINAFRVMENLQSLNIQNCSAATSNVYQTLSMYAKRLEVLKISSDDEPYGQVAAIHKLEHLEISTNRLNVWLQREFLEQLVARKADQLKVFKLVGMFNISQTDAELIGRLHNLREFSCICVQTLNDEHLEEFGNLTRLEHMGVSMSHQLSANGLIRMMTTMPCLERMDIMRCTQLNENFIMLVINMLKKRKPMPKKPLHINVSGTQIEPNILENEHLMAATHLVSLTFTEPLEISAQIRPLGMNQVIYHMLHDDDEIDDDDDDEMDVDVQFDFGGPIDMYGVNEINPNANIHGPINVSDLAQVDDDEMFFGFNIFGRYMMIGNAHEQA